MSLANTVMKALARFIEKRDLNIKISRTRIREMSIGKGNREDAHTSLEKVKCSGIYLSLFYCMKHEKEADGAEYQREITE